MVLVHALPLGLVQHPQSLQAVPLGGRELVQNAHEGRHWPSILMLLTGVDQYVVAGREFDLTECSGPLEASSDSFQSL